VRRVRQPDTIGIFGIPHGYVLVGGRYLYALAVADAAKRFAPAERPHIDTGKGHQRSSFLYFENTTAWICPLRQRA
jgi:hypothetical protein